MKIAKQSRRLLRLSYYLSDTGLCHDWSVSQQSLLELMLQREKKNGHFDDS